MRILPALLFLLAGTCSAKGIGDIRIDFSVDVPESTALNTLEHDQGGRSLTLIYRNLESDDSFVIIAVRADNGGQFGMPHATFFARMMDGMSRKVGTSLAAPPRTLSYLGHPLYIGQHEGVGDGSAYTFTTIVFFEERGTWRKLINLQLITRGRAPGDDFIVERLTALKFRPTLPPP